MRTALLTAATTLALSAGGALAGTYSFAGFSFDQDRATDTLGLLGNSETLGGAAFSSNFATRITRSVGFVAISGNANSGIVGQPGFDPSRSLGRQGFAQQGLTQSDGSNSIYASAINLPNNNDGSGSAARRHGLEMSWSNRALANGAGADFLLYESASSASAQEAFMIRARDADTGEWSRWYFRDADGFENYVESGEGAHAFAFDMSDLGFADGDLIDMVQLANLKDTDRIDGADSAAGFVNFDGTGLMAQFLNGASLTSYDDGSFDPDPLYAVALGDLVTLGQVIPLPTGGAMALAGLTILGVQRRRH
jgi:hypothetical protein